MSATNGCVVLRQAGKLRSVNGLASFDDEEPKDIEEDIGVGGESLLVRDGESIIFEVINKLVLVGDLTEIDRCEILQVRFHLACEFIEEASLLEEGHQEIDLAFFRKQLFRDFQRFNSIRHEHEARGENDHVELGLRFLPHVVEVHLLDLHVLVLLEDLLCGR